MDDRVDGRMDTARDERLPHEETAHDEPANEESPCDALPRSLEDLAAQITELAGHLNAATYRWLTLIAEFDRREGWCDGALLSCAHWLNFKCGLNLGAAREKVRVAHALPGLPKIAAAMARGELSYSKVRALTRVATPATEDNLLNIALHGTAHHVETVVRLFRRAQEAAELSREAQQQSGRALDYWYDFDGSVVVKARLPALAGALVIEALKAAVENDGQDGSQDAYPMRRADALATIAETYLEHRTETAAGTGADRFQVVVHVDAETLKHQGPGSCHIEHGAALPVETVRRLTCDSSLVRITENERGEPLDVGRKTRTIPAALRRALRARDADCCFPGCTHHRYIDAHHIEHWVDGGETKLSNLVSLCRSHHRLVHEGGISVGKRPDGGWRFVRPDGRDYEDCGCEAANFCDWTALGEAHARAGIVIDEMTAACRWTGERMDYELGVSVLCQQAGMVGSSGTAAADSASSDVSAETQWLSDVHDDVGDGWTPSMT